MKNSYKIKDFMPMGYAGQCSLTCMVWIINYFYDTFFWSKDMFDLSAVVKFGKWQFGDVLNIYEIALFLERSYFDITLFSGMIRSDWEYILHGLDKKKMVDIYKKYMNPILHKYIDWTTWHFEEWDTMEMVDLDLQSKLANSDVKFIYELMDKDLLQSIKSNQDIENWTTLFLLWLNYNILHNISDHDDKPAGHMVLTTGLDQDNNFIIYEPIRPRPNPILIPQQTVLKAIHFMEPYEILMVKNNLSY